jgi:hypothetical protein
MSTLYHRIEQRQFSFTLTLHLPPSRHVLSVPPDPLKPSLSASPPLELLSPTPVARPGARANNLKVNSMTQRIALLVVWVCCLVKNSSTLNPTIQKTPRSKFSSFATPNIKLNSALSYNLNKLQSLRSTVNSVGSINISSQYLKTMVEATTEHFQLTHTTTIKAPKSS